MIVDCHTHLTTDLPDCDTTGYWRKHHQIPPCLLEPYLQAMADVDRVIVLAWPYPPHSASGNEAVAQLVRQYGDKFVPFYAINPRLPSAQADLERAVGEWGAAGIKMSSLYMNFQPDDEQYFPLYARIEELQLPVMWHQGSSYEATEGPLEWAHPWRLDKVARTFPGMKIIISHLGFPWMREVVALLRKRANIYTDISVFRSRTWVLYNALVDAVQYGAADKVFFGTDYPLSTPSEMRDALYEVAGFSKGTNLPAISQEVVEGIIHRNCLEMLGIGQKRGDENSDNP